MRAVGLALCLGLLTACVPADEVPNPSGTVGGAPAAGSQAAPGPEQAVGADDVSRPRRGVVVAYVPFWDQARGFATVAANADVLTDVSPWWYSVWPDGTVGPQWQGADHVDLATVRALQARGLRVVPTVSNHRDGEWEPGPVARVLREPVVQDAHVRSIVELVVAGGYDGIDLDYEDLAASDRDRFTSLVARIAGELRPLGKVVTVDVHPKADDTGDDPRNEAQDFAALGAAADQLRLMAYDLHNDETGPGPIAPADWLTGILDYVLSVVPAERVVLGIPLFGYAWSPAGVDGVTWEDARAGVAAAGSPETITHPDESAYRYGRGDQDREVWYYDAGDVLDRVALARERGLGGVFFWRLGGEDPSVWPALREKGTG